MADVKYQRAKPKSNSKIHTKETAILERAERPGSISTLRVSSGVAIDQMALYRIWS